MVTAFSVTAAGIGGIFDCKSSDPVAIMHNIGKSNTANFFIEENLTSSRHDSAKANDGLRYPETSDFFLSETRILTAEGLPE